VQPDANEFDRLCVLVATADDIVLCRSDTPPAPCVIVKHDDISSLTTSARRE
jgi:hypothetical protein